MRESSRSSTARLPGPSLVLRTAATSRARHRAAVRTPRSRPPRRCPRSNGGRPRAPGSAAIRGEPVAGATDRLHRGPTEGTVELGAEAPDVDLDDVGVPLEIVVPHVGQDVPLGDDLA